MIYYNQDNLFKVVFDDDNLVLLTLKGSSKIMHIETYSKALEYLVLWMHIILWQNSVKQKTAKKE